MNDYTAKKSLGQHFLTDSHITQKIIESFSPSPLEVVLEIGPGKGVLTEYLFQRYGDVVYVCDIDERSISYLKKKYPERSRQLIQADIMQLDFDLHFGQKQVSVIGNFPYNISTQIIFKLLEEKYRVPLIIGMFQKEVAKRFAASHGNKEYGITTVLLQAYYDVQYLFDVSPESFSPPPKVTSGVIEITRKVTQPKILHEELFIKMIKAGFNMRRKTLRNALAVLGLKFEIKHQEILTKRAEQLSVEDWILFANEMTKQ